MAVVDQLVPPHTPKYLHPSPRNLGMSPAMAKGILLVRVSEGC